MQFRLATVGDAKSCSRRSQDPRDRRRQRNRIRALITLRAAAVRTSEKSTQQHETASTRCRGVRISENSIAVGVRFQHQLCGLVIGVARIFSGCTYIPKKVDGKCPRPQNTS